MTSPDSRIPKLIFIAVLCAGLLTMTGKLRDSDEFPMILTTQSICERGTFAIENLNGEGNPLADEWSNMWFNWQHMEDFQYGDRDSAGNLYSKYGFLSSAIFIPMWFVGMLSAALIGLHGADRLSFIVFIAGLTTPILLALCAVLLFRIGRFLGYGVRTSAYLSLALALCSNLLVYGGMYMSEVPQVTFLLMAWYFLFGFIYGGKPPLWAFLCALSYSFMLLVKFADIIYIVPLLFIAAGKIAGPLWDSYSRLLKGQPVPKAHFRRYSQAVFALIIGILIFPIIFNLYNYARFSDPMKTGYIPEYQNLYVPIYYGLIGFLVSPGTSLFLYFPPAILFFWSMKKFARKYPMEIWFLVFHAAIQVIFYSRLVYWAGFWNWGPRYALPILPALLLPVGMLIEGEGSKRYLNGFRRLCYAGFLVQLPVLFIHFNEFIRLMRNTFGEPACYIKMFYIPPYSPILCNWWLLLSKFMGTVFHFPLNIWGMGTEGYTSTKLFFVVLSRDIPAMAPFFIIAAIVFLCGAVYAASQLKRVLQVV